MTKKHGLLVSVLPVAQVVGGVATASALILMTILQNLTLFALVGLTFATYADVQVVADLPAEAVACDMVISFLDDHGQVIDTVQVRVPAGEATTFRHRSRSGPGDTETIRATVRSWTVPRSPVPPGPCPVLASMQVVDASSGKTLAILLPAAQRTERELIPVP